MTPGRLIILVTLGFAFVLRLAISISIPNVHWPDEILQVTEPAHRIVFGTGIVTWEWLVGIRSWLLPGIFVGLMGIGRALGESDPVFINLPGELMMATLGCLPVLCAACWGRNLYGSAGALVAGIATACWTDLLYMSPHTLGEVVAADLLPLALYLGQPYRNQQQPTETRRFGSGFLLGLTFVVRFHLAPALLLAAIGLCGGKTRASWLTGAGAAIPILTLGLLDWATLGSPFQSIWLNIWYNVFQGVSQEYGTEPWWALAATIAVIWWPVLPILLVTGYCGARRMPVVGLVALAILVTHAAIPHKEYRFIYPAIPLFIAMAGVGTAAIMQHCREYLTAHLTVPWSAAIGSALWLVMSLDVSTRPFMNPAWTRDAGFLAAYAEINRLPQICAVATNHSVASPGNTWLRPGVRLYQINLVDIAAPRLVHAADSFNAIAASSKVHMTDPRFHRMGCHDGNLDEAGAVHLRICVWVRPGGCDPHAAPPPEPYWPDYFRRRMGLPRFDWGPTLSEAGP